MKYLLEGFFFIKNTLNTSYILNIQISLIVCKACYDLCFADSLQKIVQKNKPLLITNDFEVYAERGWLPKDSNQFLGEILPMVNQVARIQKQNQVVLSLRVSRIIFAQDKQLMTHFSMDGIPTLLIDPSVNQKSQVASEALIMRAFAAAAQHINIRHLSRIKSSLQSCMMNIAAGLVINECDHRFFNFATKQNQAQDRICLMTTLVMTLAIFIAISRSLASIERSIRPYAASAVEEPSNPAVMRQSAL